MRELGTNLGFHLEAEEDRAHVDSRELGPHTEGSQETHTQEPLGGGHGVWGRAIYPALSKQEMLLSQTNLGHGLFPLGTPSGPQLGTALLPMCPMRQSPSSG